MKDKISFLFFFLFVVINSFGQPTSIIIELKFNNKPIVLGQKYVSKNSDTLSIETIRFYLSSFEINYKDKTRYKEATSYHLIDFDKPESLLISLKNSSKKEIKSIKFNVGVDSLASVSGAMEDDLDATNGMYWAWQSGFINMKIEGTSKSCKTRKNQFHFHVGGYLQPNYAMREMIFNWNDNINFNEDNSINLVIDLAKLFDEINLKETNSIMIPGKEAMIIADKSVKMFSIK